jgi:type I restriction enzyme S subunit
MRGANGLSTAYLRYVIGSKSFTDHVKSITTGVNVPHISAKDIKRYRLPLPPMDVQRQTAEILGFYDALIELNRRRITMLEEIARCLFEEWFVQLRFPGHEQAPRKETTHGPIPQAWRLDSLGTTLSTLESGSRPLGGIQVLPEGVPSIGAENIKGLGNYDYRKERLVTRAYFESMRRGVIQSGDVLLYKDGAYIGRMALFRDGYPYSDCAVNEHVFILRPRAPMSSAYLYFWLSQGKLLATMRGMNTNAAQPGLNQATVRSLPIVVPSEDILDAFSRLVDPILGALFCYAKANRLLDVARDLLLPRLVSAGLSLGAAKLALGGVD